MFNAKLNSFLTNKFKAAIMTGNEMICNRPE